MKKRDLWKIGIVCLLIGSTACSKVGQGKLPNIVFLLSDDQTSALRAAGAVFYPWMGGSQRLVCSWATTADEVDAFLGVLKG